mmetsp:Transcript_10354/g.26906  ORF Transcript_10354/g.26906 Transcript_10354/m.26906 type:complete len:204 (-) Transcript_10354:448-1059(-)
MDDGSRAAGAPGAGWPAATHVPIPRPRPDSQSARTGEQLVGAALERCRCRRDRLAQLTGGVDVDAAAAHEAACHAQLGGLPTLAQRKPDPLDRRLMQADRLAQGHYKLENRSAVEARPFVLDVDAAPVGLVGDWAERSKLVRHKPLAHGLLLRRAHREAHVRRVGCVENVRVELFVVERRVDALEGGERGYTGAHAARMVMLV